MTALNVLAMPQTECACDGCKGMCRNRPCWPTPAEARALIDAGHAERMMNDWNRRDVQAVSVLLGEHVCDLQTQKKLAPPEGEASK